MQIMSNKSFEEKKCRFSNFLAEVEQELCLDLENEGSRFPSSDRLLKKFKKLQFRFTEKVSTLSREQLDRFIKEATELVNEMCVARKILTESSGVIERLEYEPPLPHTSQTIDFQLVAKYGRYIWWDVKTIHPDRKNNWDDYEKHKKNSLFTDNVQLQIEKDDFGGEIYHKYYASRQKFLQYTLELEKKIAHFEKTGMDEFVMVFCGNGWDWELDDLEDFVDFYINGYHRCDDPFAKMEKHYIRSNGISLIRNINQFCYLERHIDKIEATKWVKNVRGPWFGLN